MLIGKRTANIPALFLRNSFTFQCQAGQNSLPASLAIHVVPIFCWVWTSISRPMFSKLLVLADQCCPSNSLWFCCSRSFSNLIKGQSFWFFTYVEISSGAFSRFLLQRVIMVRVSLCWVGNSNWSSPKLNFEGRTHI